MPELSLPVRTAIFLAYIVAFYIVYSWVGPGRWWRPSGGGADLWFLGVVGLVAMRLIEAPFFRKPADTLVAVLLAAFALWAVDLGSLGDDHIAHNIRLVAAGYFLIIAIAALLSVGGLRSGAPVEGKSVIPYRLSTRLGAPELLFTPAVLVSLIGFHEILSQQGVVLLAGWLIMVTSQPLEEVSRWLIFWRSGVTAGGRVRRIGTVERIDRAASFLTESEVLP